MFLAQNICVEWASVTRSFFRDCNARPEIQEALGGIVSVGDTANVLARLFTQGKLEKEALVKIVCCRKRAARTSKSASRAARRSG